MSKGLELLCDSRHGVYIPEIMINRLIDAGWVNISQWERETLQSADNDHYWDAWDQVLGKSEYTDENGYVWRLYHDGDLWAYCEDLMTDEEKYNFFGEY